MNEPNGFSNLDEEVVINLKYQPAMKLTLADILDQHVMLTAFRHAANSIGQVTGTIVSHVPHDEAAKSVTGDHYFLELIAESELRYKRLKAAASELTQLNRSRDPSVAELMGAMTRLEEVLK